MIVEFKFKPGEFVTLEDGATACIDHCVLDRESRKFYLVVSGRNNEYLHESNLTKTEGANNENPD